MRETMQMTLFENGTHTNGHDGSPTYRAALKAEWMPEEWTLQRLGKLISSIDGGKSFSGEDRQAEPGEAGVLKVSAVSYDRFLHEEHKAITDQQRQDAKTSPREGTILISRSNTYDLVGASVYIDRDYPNLFLPDTLWRISTREDVDARWLSYLLASDYMRRQFYRIATGTSGSMKKLAMRELRKVKVPTPPHNEQNQVAQTIAYWDHAIERLDALIAAEERQKRGLMQRLLTGEVRLEAFQDDPWPERPLYEVGKIVTGSTPDTGVPEYWDGDIAWCTPTDITDLGGAKYLDDTERHITGSGLSSISAKLLPEKSLVVCTRATIGECAINTVPVATNQGFKSIIPDDETDVEYLYYQIIYNRHELERVGSGSTFLEVSKRDFRRIKLPFPSHEEQQQIGSILATADREIAALHEQRAAYEREKKALMQRLLTGRKRIPEDYTPPAL